jgi:hypothetical protein
MRPSRISMQEQAIEQTPPPQRQNRQPGIESVMFGRVLHPNGEEIINVREQRPCRTFADAVIRLAPIPVLARRE